MREEKTLTYTVISKQIEKTKSATNQYAKVIIEGPDGMQYSGKINSWLFDRLNMGCDWPKKKPLFKCCITYLQMMMTRRKRIDKSSSR